MNRNKKVDQLKFNRKNYFHPFIASKKNPFVDQCASYVEKYAAECFQTASFLDLPKEALVHLVSSDSVRNIFSIIPRANNNLSNISLIIFQLALEEERVWRSVLNWARHKTGIDQPLCEWNEDHKSRIRQV